MSGDCDAYWIPGPADFDMDDGLELGYEWLESVTVGRRVVVLPMARMVSNRPTLRRATMYAVVSPRTRHVVYGDAGAVLVIWPDPATLEFAEQVALEAPICVIPYKHDVAWWIAKRQATNLIPSKDQPPVTNLASAVTDALDSILMFGGHNRFVGGGEKEYAVGDLRALVAAGHRPTPAELESYALASGETDVEGARRLRGFYEAILDRRTLRDGRGRSI